MYLRRIVCSAARPAHKILGPWSVSGRLSEALTGKSFDSRSPSDFLQPPVTGALGDIPILGHRALQVGSASGTRAFHQGSMATGETRSGKGDLSAGLNASSSSSAMHSTYDRDSLGGSPLASWQRAAIAVGSAVGALANPARADLVAALGETTGLGAYRRMLSQMQQSEEGQQLLRERPRVTAAAVAHAWECPPGTFGAAYAQFMGSRNFSVDDRPTVRFIDDHELAFVAARAREVHDFWHVLFGLPTNVTGELALKMVELVQTGMPMCALSVIGGPLRLSPEKRQVLRSQYIPWAIKAGLRCVDLMSIRYEKHFHENIEDLRNRWRIIPAPKRPKA